MLLPTLRSTPSPLPSHSRRTQHDFRTVAFALQRIGLTRCDFLGVGHGRLLYVSVELDGARLRRFLPFEADLQDAVAVTSLDLIRVYVVGQRQQAAELTGKA